MITLILTIPKNQLPIATQQERIEDAVLNQGEYEMLGLTEDSDLTTEVGDTFLRTIELTESSRFLLENPTDDARKGTVENLFRSRLSRLILTPNVRQTVTLS